MVRKRCGGQLSGKLWCLLFILLTSLGLSNSVWAEERYVLQNRFEESGNSSVTEVYLDKKTQRLIVKEFDLDSPTTSRNVGTEYRRLAEAWNHSPKGYALRKVSDFDLKTAKGQEQAQSFYQDTDPTQGSQAFQQTMNRVRTGPSRYRLIQIGERGNSQVGLYFNDQTGDFVFQSVSNKSERKHEFPRTVGLLSDLKNVGDDQTPLDFKVLPARTWNQFHQGRAEVIKLMEDHGFRLPEDAFDYQQRQMQAFHGKLERIFIKERASGIFEEVLYNPETHELLYRQYSYNSSGAQNVIEEVFYDLNDDVGFQAAMNRFQGLGEEALKAKRELLASTGGCEAPLSSSGALTNTAERNLEDINAIMESMWRSQLQGGLPNALRPGNNNTFTMDFNLLGKNHALVGNLDRHGNLIDLNFRNPALARDKKMRIRHILGDDGKKQFMVEALNEVSGEWESQLVLESEVGYNPHNNQPQMRLAAYLRGQQGEGQFDFDGFEKSVYGLQMRQGRLTGIEARFRYDGSRKDEYRNVGYKREGSGGLINFAFHFFFSANGRKEKVRDTILEKAREELRNSEFGELITDGDIQRVANEVTRATQVRTNNFDHSKNRVEAVATEEAYSRFGDLILTRMMATLLPEDKEESINQMVDVVMRDLRLCLRKASEARNTDMASRCLDVFMKEAPIDVGKEILKLKIAQAGLGDFGNVAEKEFLACTQEKYDPIKAKTEGTKSVSVIQACLYQALVTTVDKVSPALIDEKVGELSRELNLNLSYSRSRLDAIREKTRECLREENIGAYGPGGYRFNTGALGNLDADYFEQAFMKCANLLVEDVALSVGEVALNAKLTEIDLPDAAKARIVHESFEPGMQGCMDAQKRTIAQIRERYRREKEQLLARNGGDTNVRLGFTVPSFDPLECTRVLTNLATGKATIETIKEMLGDKYDEVLEKEGKDPAQCFERLNQELIESSGIWIVENSNLPKERVKLEQKKRDEEVERRSSDCLKEAIGIVSYYVAQDVVAEKLSENPDYASIQLTDEVKDLIGKSVKQCFARKLENINTVTEILEQQEKLKDICGAELLKDPNVAPGLFSPFVENAIGKVEMSEETKAKVIPKVVEALRLKLADAKDLDEAMTVIDGFKGEAVPIVLEGILQEKVHGMLEPGDERGREEANRLVTLVQTEIFGADGQGELGQKLVAALDSEVEGELDSVIAEIEVKAAQILGPDLLRSKAEKMLLDGVLESAADVEFVVTKGSEILLACLEKAKEEKIEKPIDHCESETTVQVTELILKSKLKDKLDNHPLIGKIFSEEEKENLLNELVDEERMNKLREITAMEDGEAKDKAMDSFVLRFKVDATEKVFTRGIAGIVEEKLPNPRYYQDEDKRVLDRIRGRIASEAEFQIQECLAPVKVGLDQPDHTLTELDLDNCLNQVRLKATVDILPKRLELILNYLHGDQDRVKNLLESAITGFTSCARKNSFKIDAKKYGNYLDGCLLKTINDFVGDIITDMRETEPVMLSGGDTRADWNACRENLKERAKKHVFGDLEAPAVLDSMSEENFYAELYRFGESKDPQTPPNIDWLEPNLIECAIEKLVPNATIEFRTAFLERHKDSLDPTTKQFILSLTDTVHRIFSEERADGTPLYIELDSLFGKSSEEKAPAIAARDAAPTSRPTPILEMLKEYEPKVIEYLNMIAAYDPEGMQAAIEKFERDTLEKLKDSEGKVPLDRAVDALLNSDLSNLLIESMVASMVREQTLKALKEEGADTSVVWKLSSKEMIHRLYGSGEGLAAIESMKKNYLKPLLEGRLDSLDIPKDVMADLTAPLVKDTQLNGFVETLFGAVIQKKLDDKRDWIESGWTAIFKMSYAGWSGYNKHRDFTWGDQYNTSRARYHLRLTPSGKKATERFADQMLGPMLRGELSEADKKREEEALEDLVQEAMDENN